MSKRSISPSAAALAALSVSLALSAGALALAGPASPVDLDLPIGASWGLPAPEEDPPAPPDPEPFDEDDVPQLYDEDVPVESDSIVFVLDVSGSMNWGAQSFTGADGQPTYGSRLDRAKAELTRAIQSLSESFLFNVHAYSCVWKSWSVARQRAVPAAKAAASGWVQSLQAGGGTGTGPSVSYALGERDNKTVVLLSDGAPNCIDNYGGTPDQHRRIIRDQNLQRAKIHCFGIAAMGVCEQFLRDVAADSGGRYYFVP